MAYNNGNFTLFNQTGFTASSQIFAETIAPAFNPPSGGLYANVYGSKIFPSVISTGPSTVLNVYGLNASLSISAPGSTVSSAHTLNVIAPTIAAGNTLTNVYALFVSPPTATTGTAITNKYTASIFGFVGIGTTSPKNALDVYGSVSVGSYAGAVSATATSLIVSGLVGIGTTSPRYPLDVQGIASALNVNTDGTLKNNQKVALFEGYNQGGFGGGSVGTNKTMSSNTTLASFQFPGFPVAAQGLGFNGTAFDGRYVYFIPGANGTTSLLSRFYRYDTTLPFTASNTLSTGFTFYDLSSVNSLCAGFRGGLFDGRYVYLIPSIPGGIASVQTRSGLITRYDTTMSFSSTSSYTVFDMAANINSNCCGFSGGTFDGRYIYLAPYLNRQPVLQNSLSGQATRYDTTLSFSSSASYSFFDMTSINSLNSAFLGAEFDGRYVYYITRGLEGLLTYNGQIVRYDTTLSFGASTSYAFFDTTANVNSLSNGFYGGVFDGRYLYLVPQINNSQALSGQVTRYDTTLNFQSASSYAIYDMQANVNSNAQTFTSAVFDGRYIYYVPGANTQGRVTRYDTTSSFTSASSYSVLDVSGLVPGNDFYGSIFDGRYVYLAPCTGGNKFVRLDAYPGPQATAINASQSIGGIAMGAYSGAVAPPTNGLVVSGSVGIGTATPAFTLDVQGAISALPATSAGTTKNNQGVQLFEGYNQGGFGGGSVGTNKAMSANTTAYFDTSTISSISNGFTGGVFDGRYIYCSSLSFTTTSNGQITRYDTTLSFSSSNSYAVFNTQSINTNSAGFWGSVFDGRYVYFVPSSNGTTYVGQITRYDTTLSFVSSSSYSFFDLQTQVNSLCVGFVGGIFDGRYIYFVPLSNILGFSGQMARYDTTLSFAQPSSYAYFDTKGVNANSQAFYGGSFDGRYLYLAPSNSNVITRYDTTLSFTAAGSYAFFDTNTITGASNSYAGAVFDGRYMYFIPYFLNSRPGEILRYDTTSSFSSSVSYTIYNTKNVNTSSYGFFGGLFDGRYLYLSPGLNGVITRYDTTQSFSVSPSYSFLATATGTPSTSLFLGCVFDGRYMYLPPNANTIFARIDVYPGSQVNAINASQSPNGIALGTYAGVIAPPTNGLIVSGNVGIGTASPAYTLDIQGVLSAQSAKSAGTTIDNQVVQLFEGYNQGGFGGGAVGANKTMSANTTAVFNTALFVNSRSVGFQGGVFDGRYVYFVPNFDNSTSSGQITRYDSFSSFSNSASYAIFDMAAINSASIGFSGGVFDGRYVYFVPFFSTTFSGLVARYDTQVSFSSLSSYAFIDLKTINSAASGFIGGAFDGRYVYFVPDFFSLITRYDTTLPFNTTASFSTFDSATGVNSNSQGFIGGSFDGRYVYFVPNLANSTASGYLTRYDTTLSFSSSSSYSYFNTVTLSPNSSGYRGSVFDGRYLYLVPNVSQISFSGQITRYDTTLSFSSSVSYSFFDTTSINCSSKGFFGGVFDGRYVYLSPTNNGSAFGQVTRYDTTQSFSASTSYSFFDTTQVNSASKGFIGAVFDGRYVYLVPQTNGSFFGQITRIDAYPGPQVNVISASFSPSGVALGTYAGVITPPTSGLIVSGQVGIGTATPAYSLDIQGALSAQSIQYAGTTRDNQLTVLSQGYNQGGSGGGSVGTNKTMSQNTTIYSSAPNTKFNGAAFDGRYIYFAQAAFVTGTINRYDTTLSFTDSNSFAAFNVMALNSNCQAFTCSAYDGRYVYFITFQSPLVIPRYDTTLPFSASTSYTLFNVSNVNTLAILYQSCVFDGRYLYLLPQSGPNEMITRYDTSASFTSSTSYSFIAQNVISTQTLSFQGGAYDGRYVYMVPLAAGGADGGVLVRYDTTLTFSTSTSFGAYDLSSNLNTNLKAFCGGVFDGRYVYLIPTIYSTMARYDTTLPFNQTTSYSVFVPTTVTSLTASFKGGVFDGRYLYLVPFSGNGTQSGTVVRYDSTLTFSLTTSYSFFDTSVASAGSSGFFGGVFDGRYVYLVPFTNRFGNSNLITRLDAYPGSQASAIAASFTPNGIALGAYFGTVQPPAGGLIVSGSVGIGTPTPSYPLDIQGFAAALSVKTSGTTIQNQRVVLDEGYNQGGWGGGSVGLNKTMSSNTTATFNTSLLSTVSVGFFGGVYDGRYVYFVPLINGSSQSGQLLRYDTTQSFSASLSYAFFDTTKVQSNSQGFFGGIFDGRYIYLVPHSTTLSYSGQVTRYDTASVFSSSASYAVFDTATATNGSSRGFNGAIFDGRYIYYVPNFDGNISSGQITRYDTTLSFTSAGSYAAFDTRVLVNSQSAGFYGGTFDGRYVYYSPLFNGTTVSGQITQYDTTLPFASSTSYAVYNTKANVNSNSCGFIGTVFDGRYIYYIPNNNGGGVLQGQITRYDTALPFATASSYAIFDTKTNVNSNSIGFEGGLFDGRYLYLVPNGTGALGQVTRYDVTLPFTSASSYSIFNTSTLQSNSRGFVGMVFDGKYVYLVPNITTPDFGVITRIDAYPGPRVNALAASQAGNSFFIGSLAGTTTVNSTLVVTGNVGIGTASPQYPVDIAGNMAATIINAPRTTMNSQKVALYQGYSQGGFGGGAVGANKTMSVNTTDYFDTQAYVDANSGGFAGAVFDGRFVYYVPNASMLTYSGQITRYDTSLPFGVSTSYSVFNTTVLSSNSRGFFGGVFDGRYVYFVPISFSTFVRYDTTAAFSASTSYEFFEMTNVSASTKFFKGAVFDGQYIYLCPIHTTSAFLTRYDTTLSFSVTQSYAFVNLTTAINTMSGGLAGGVFDGQYVYLIPGVNGQITRYDTSLNFNAAASYSYFNTATINSVSTLFVGGVFDGRYIYLANASTAAGQVTRYDTKLSFGSSTSYAFFDTTVVQSNSVGFQGSVFDGRYVYFVPSSESRGQVTRYDTTLPFGNSASYAVFNTAAANSNSKGFIGAVSDGRYIYLVPNYNGTTSGQITRLGAYSGPLATAPSIGFATGTFTVTGTLGFNTSTTATASAGGGQNFLNTAAGFLVILVNGTPQKIAFYNP